MVDSVSRRSPAARTAPTRAEESPSQPAPQSSPSEQPAPSTGWQAKPANAVATKLDGWVREATDPQTLRANASSAFIGGIVTAITGGFGWLAGPVGTAGGVAVGVAVTGALRANALASGRAIDKKEVGNLVRQVKMMVSDGASESAWLPTQALKREAVAVLLEIYQGRMPTADGKSLPLTLQDDARDLLGSELTALKAASPRD